MDIAINTYSLRNEWKDLGNDKMAVVIALCHDMGISKVELLDHEYTKDNLQGIVKRLADNGISVHALAPHGKILVKPNEVKNAIEEGKSHLELAHSVGASSVRFQIGDGPLPRAFAPMDDFEEEEWADYREGMEEAINFSEPVVSPLIETAEKLGVNIGLETHHSYSSNYIYMDLFNQRFNSKRIGWIFDIGNYENDSMRWKALEIIKGRTFYIHAKGYDFDAQGLEKDLDYPKACQILADAGFKGTWSIEFEGKMNGIFGLHKLNELIKYSISKVKGQTYSINTAIPSAEELMKKYQKK
jgi:sugar phosphate isomerase/epimerase